MDECFRTSFVKGTIKFGKTVYLLFFWVKSHKKEQLLDYKINFSHNTTYRCYLCSLAKKRMQRIVSGILELLAFPQAEMPIPDTKTIA